VFFIGYPLGTFLIKFKYLYLNYSQMVGVLDKGVGLPVYRSACLPVKIVVSRQYLVFSKKNAGKKEENISPTP